MPGRRRVQRGDALGVRLELAQPVAVEAAQAGDAVLASAPLERVEARDLVVASSATMTLPQRSTGTSWRSQNA